jgi:aminoglycoside phosphotransferase (APT) family kinase protein
VQPTEGERRRPLTDAQLERLRAALFPDALGLTSAPLLGGIATATFAISAHSRNGLVGEAVIRCYRGGWSRVDAVARARMETLALDAVAPLIALAPRVLLADPEGELIGEPLLAMGRLPGASLPPPAGLGRDRFLRAFALGLATVHAVDVARLPTGFRREGDASAVLERVETKVRDDQDDPLSRELLAALHRSAEALDDVARALIHHDYWFGNTLWRDGELTGIVDWGSSRVGDPRQDVALARSDCALFLDIDAADQFLHEYEHRAGPIGDLVFWDLLSALLGHRWMDEWLVGYRELGVDLPIEEARRRIVVFAERALDRA